MNTLLDFSLKVVLFPVLLSIEGRAARPNFNLINDSRFFCVFPFYTPSLPVCATLKTFAHVSNPFCIELHCLHCQNLPNTSFELAVFCKTVQASIPKDAYKDASVLQVKFCMRRLCLCHCQSFPKFIQVRNCTVKQ